MQEEVENKTVRLAVTTTKLTMRAIYKGLKDFIDEQKAKIVQEEKDTTVKGKQSVKELIGQNQGVSSMPIGDSGIRDFKKIANKYGVDFAIVKDKTEEPPRYTVFFKARDADAITSVLKEYADKQTRRKRLPKRNVRAFLRSFRSSRRRWLRCRRRAKKSGRRWSDEKEES